MSIELTSYASSDIVRKNYDNFSFLSTAFSLYGNRSISKIQHDLLCCNIENTCTYPWLALSAVGEAIGGKFYEFILNFIDNVSDIDLCNIESIQSLLDMIGADYSVLKNIQTFPDEIRHLIDIFSVRREYLLNSKKINGQLVNQLSCTQLSDSSNISSSVLSISHDRQEYLSLDESHADNWCTVGGNISVSMSKYIDDNLLSAFMFNTFVNMLSSKMSMTYNDIESTVIYKSLSTDILCNDFELHSSNSEEMLAQKTLYNVDSSFDVYAEADNIDNGLSSLNDYSNYERLLVQQELDSRSNPYAADQMQTRYKYYRELEVKQYFDFMKTQYLDYEKIYQNTLQYFVDKDYMLLPSNQFNTYSLLLSTDIDGNLVLNEDAICKVASTLVQIVNSIRDVRQNLKTQCQKNFMKGTFLLLSYVIDEYLKTNVVDVVKKLSKEDVGKEVLYSEIVEYYDPTQYFNISCTTDDASDDVNLRYWEVSSTVSAIAPIDNTDIFSDLPKVTTSLNSFTSEQISSFYVNAMHNRLAEYESPALKSFSMNDRLNQFLNAIFDLGADDTFKDSNMLCIDVTDQQLSAVKALLYDEYSADIMSEYPYYYFSNTRHPSYQLHPFLSNFIQKDDYIWPVQNTVNDELNSTSKELSSDWSSYVDQSGYLINMWKNPINSNTDYQVRYETSQHIDDLGNENEVVDYDGLFYPKMIQSLKFHVDNDTLSDLLSAIESNAQCINGIPEDVNYFYGLDLTDNERQHIVDQISVLHDIILDTASDECKVISQYALDGSKNAYILMKTLPTADSDIDDAVDGVLWIKKRNQPIAFPAFVTYSQSDNYTVLGISQVNTSLKSNQLFAKASKVSLGGILYSYEIDDFFMSYDQSTMLFNLRSTDHYYTAIATIDQQFDYFDQTTKLYLNKISTSTADADKLIAVPSSQNPIFLCFFNKDFQPGAAYAIPNINTSSKSIYITACYYAPLSRDTIAKSNTTVTCDNGIVLDDGICGCSYDDSIIVAYVSELTLNDDNVKTYLGDEIDYVQSKQYMTEQLSNCIKTHSLKFYGNQLQDTEKDLYNCYTDAGMFGLVEGAGKNQLYKSLMSYNSNSETSISAMTYGTELATRGMLRFQLIGAPKAKGQFRNVLLAPLVRMDERFKLPGHSSDSLSAARYDDARYRSLTGKLTSDIDDAARFDQKAFDNIIRDNSDVGLKVDEKYIADLEKNDPNIRQRLQNAAAPLLWHHGDDDIPDELYNPYTRQRNADSDNFELTLFKGYEALSVSYVSSDNGDIQLDFNTNYFKQALDPTDIWNEKHKYLTLPSAGDSGIIDVWNGDTLLVEYYVKNISDQHPKFLLSANIKQLMSSVPMCIMTEDGKLLVTDQVTGEPRYIITETLEETT